MRTQIIRRGRKRQRFGVPVPAPTWPLWALRNDLATRPGRRRHQRLQAINGGRQLLWLFLQIRVIMVIWMRKITSTSILYVFPLAA